VAYFFWAILYVDHMFVFHNRKLILTKSDRQRLEASEMWIWRRTEKTIN